MDPTPNVAPNRDRRNSATRSQLLHRVRAEFREMPCLRLTAGQAQRLFGMPADVCERVFAALMQEGTLTRGADERYGMPVELAWRGHLAGGAVDRSTPRAS